MCATRQQLNTQKTSPQVLFGRMKCPLLWLTLASHLCVQPEYVIRMPIDHDCLKVYTP